MVYWPLAACRYEVERTLCVGAVARVEARRDRRSASRRGGWNGTVEGREDELDVPKTEAEADTSVDAGGEEVEAAAAV
jgi:hypothetical protein